MLYDLGFINNTIIVQVRYSTIETKEATRIGYNGFFTPSHMSNQVKAEVRSMHTHTIVIDRFLK